MDYQQTLDYLYSFLDSVQHDSHRRPELNLARTRALLAAFGDPQHTFRSVVIAGTKGKGSTAALIEAIARASGLRVGLWTSPHLHSYRERIQVDRQLISQAELIHLVTTSMPVINAVTRGPHGAPTTFAIGFALALRYFASQRIDLAVLEVGLGGMYDSAAVVPPLLSVITPVSYDHMELLGYSLAEIATQKAGIIKPGVPAITSPQHPEALAVIARVAEETHAPLFGVAEHAGALLPTNMQFFDPYTIYTGPHTPGLRGLFQHENARVAIGAALLLRDAGLPFNDQAIAEGVATARWPGRLEIIGETPPIVLDGAHNGDSAHRLIEALAAEFGDRRIVLVFGTSRDKDLERILAELAPHANALILTYSRHPRASTNLADLEALAVPLLPQGAPVVYTHDVPEAIDAARQIAGPADLICVTGSLFVVAAAREALGLAVEKD